MDASVRNFKRDQQEYLYWLARSLRVATGYPNDNTGLSERCFNEAQRHLTYMGRSFPR